MLLAVADNGEVTRKVVLDVDPGVIDRLVEVKLPVHPTGTVLVNENVDKPQPVEFLLVTAKV